jgi:hypothetical protein
MGFIPENSYVNATQPGDKQRRPPLPETTRPRLPGSLVRPPPQRPLALAVHHPPFAIITSAVM